MTHPILEIIEGVYKRGYLPRRLDTDKARVLSIAICGQESDLRDRDQIDSGRDVLGPALGLGQFERGGGVKGVMTHAASKVLAQHACDVAGVQFTYDAAWRALKVNDYLALAFVRLLLLTDPRALPAIGEVWPSWDYYKRNWRPGKPHPDDWPENYARALRIFKGASE